MHPNQVTISISTVRALIDTQFSDWRDLALDQVHAGGTENAIFRIGTDLVARFRLEAHDVDTTRAEVLAELEVARELAGSTRFATPEPVALGEPGGDYPLPWSVQTWIDGDPATTGDLSQSEPFAEDLAEFIMQVRGIASGGRTYNGCGRGGDLASHDDWVRECISRSAGLMDVASLSQAWAQWRELPRGDSPDVMNHCDLMPGNVLVADGRLAGVLDVGGLAAADPALDLVGAWHLLDAGPREVLRRRLGVDDEQWRRGKAWAFEQAIGLVWYYLDSNPTMSRIGRTTLDRVLGDGELDQAP
ncbi:aminoglycoside phosphotransferase [Rhodococcus sp. 15-1154-1]|nr:aminoglycoside phosphotransferase family protein [Rhodococcus sp. 15-1154-1]OZE97249.1 aminoglycoside phosphotransferase [Rhodococcus sp. 15-1154-1]